MASSKSLNSIVFNLLGGGVLVTVVGYMIMSYFTTPLVEPCTTRFAAGQQFTFHDANGKALSPVELQGRTGSREWGLLQNARVVQSSGGSTTLEVTIASTENEELNSQNGVGFTWQVPELEKASAACLSYSAYLPKGFGFKEPGHLPGLFGAADVTQIDALKPEEGFATRMGWGAAGDFGVDVRVPTIGGFFEGPRRRTVWDTGRWVNIEQEVRLNTPGQANGILRVWADGALTINRQGLTFRNAPEATFSGVVADIGYARTLSDIAKIRVSSFLVQGQ
ncbi:MAG: polysaccharide lyase [Hyphomicrobium sp.]